MPLSLTAPWPRRTKREKSWAWPGGTEKHNGHGHVFYRRLTHDYPTVDRGEGVYLYDTAERRYLDAAGGAMVVNIGHGVEKVVEAMAAQAELRACRIA